MDWQIGPVQRRLSPLCQILNLALQPARRAWDAVWRMPVLGPNAMPVCNPAALCAKSQLAHLLKIHKTVVSSPVYCRLTCTEGPEGCRRSARRAPDCNLLRCCHGKRHRRLIRYCVLIQIHCTVMQGRMAGAVLSRDSMPSSDMAHRQQSLALRNLHTLAESTSHELKGLVSAEASGRRVPTHLTPARGNHSCALQ